ncbi:hypothetical protein CSOJ01_03297 [Colletotrichum sojae]|uniref:Uncharacterized protein n=1 Tax=Colletotrichum sojae TaxID=2175907 RepID=A0A8H6JMY9_9PEZI|nr:hypothetical protein CSOJ01_03297 [Colletotrichum sojae]
MEITRRRRTIWRCDAVRPGCGSARRVSRGQSQLAGGIEDADCVAMRCDGNPLLLLLAGTRFASDSAPTTNVLASGGSLGPPLSLSLSLSLILEWLASSVDSCALHDTVEGAVATSNNTAGRAQAFSTTRLAQSAAAAAGLRDPATDDGTRSRREE